MAHQCRQGIPVSLTVKQFEEFVLPHLTVGRRGPAPKMSLFKSFGYDIPFQIHYANKTRVPISTMLNAYASLDLLSYDIIDNTHVNIFTNFINLHN